MHTALAPMHSALTTSEPRRKPLSTMIGMRPFTAAGAVDGHRHRVAAGLLRALHHGLGHFPFVGGVELVPDRLAARGAHVLDPEAGGSRQDLQMVADLGGAGGGDLALVMERSLT